MGGFIEKLNAYLTQTGQAGAGKFRLPTEAEWERAARGGATVSPRFSFGDATAGDDSCGANADASPYVWWCYNAGPLGSSQPVGLKGANPYGLLDMHGNVEEWVEDWYGSYPAGPVTDPKGPTTSGSWRVLRGGYWSDLLRYCRSAYRGVGAPSYRNLLFGFRLSRSL